MVAAATVMAGRRFQSLTVRWKKEFLYVSLLVLSWKRLVLLSLCLKTPVDVNQVVLDLV
jgi:hypothetical protein